MKLIISDKYYSDDDYSIEVEPAHVEKTNFTRNQHEYIFENDEVDIITIKFRNQLLKRGIIGMLLNIIATLAGAYSGRKLGGPFHLSMSMRVLSDKDIHIETQKYDTEGPFLVKSGDCEILENTLVSNKEYKDIWIKYTIMPLIIVLLVSSCFIGYIMVKINILFFFVYFTIVVFFSAKFLSYIKKMINI